MMNIVVFDFPESNVGINCLIKKLKFKMSRHSDFAILVDENGSVQKWRHYHDPVKGFDFEKVSTIFRISKESSGYLIDKTRNQLLYVDKKHLNFQELVPQDPKLLNISQSIFFGSNIYKMAWYHQTEQDQFLILALSNKTLVICNWNTKQLVHQFEASDDIMTIKVSGNTHELLIKTIISIELWCLKTLTCKRHYITSCHFFDLINPTTLLTISRSRNIQILGINSLSLLFEKQLQANGLFGCLIHSKSVTLLDNDYLQVWDIVHTETRPSIKLKFKIQNPYDNQFDTMKYLDPEEQTQLIMVYKHKLIYVDTRQGKIVWEKDIQSSIVEIILL